MQLMQRSWIMTPRLRFRPAHTLRLSIGSIGSVLSIGSAGSILSIGSAGSVLGIGSRRRVLNREQPAAPPTGITPPRTA